MRLETMVSWLNANQGFVFAILTAAYVVATGLLAWLAARQLRQAAQLEERRSRPYLVFDFEAGRYDLEAVVRNIGHAAALDVRLAIDPVPEPVRSGAEAATFALVSQTIRLLAPDAHFSEWLDTPGGFRKRYGSTVFSGRLQYRDVLGRQYSEPFSLCPADPEALIHVPGGDVARELRHVADAVERLAAKP